MLEPPQNHETRKQVTSNTDLQNIEDKTKMAKHETNPFWSNQRTPNQSVLSQEIELDGLRVPNESWISAVVGSKRTPKGIQALGVVPPLQSH